MKDIRRTSPGNLQYSIGEIFFLVLTGVVCGCDSWEAIDLFGREKLDRFRRYFPYRKGTPSHDTLQRFFGALDAENLGECFISWAAKTYRNMDNELVAIDGKRICGSHDRAREQAAVHVVSAFADLKTLVKITSKRILKNTGETNTETRYYISSRMSDAAQFNSLVRSLWSIENRLHWGLDVTFREDSARKRAGNSALNINMITKIAIRILAKNKGKLTKPLARLKAAVNDEYRDNLIANF